MGNRDKPTHGKTKRWRKILLWVLFLLVLTLVWAFYNGLTVKKYRLETRYINEGSLIRIVLISDLHSTIHGENQKPLIEKVKAQEPDLIVMTGDIADDYVPIEGTKLFLEGVRDTAPIYYVTGNHEYWSNDVQGIIEELQAYGVIVLSDEYEEIEVKGNKIVVAGIEDPDRREYGWEDYDQGEEMEKAFSGLGELKGYKILLAHRPERIEMYKKYPFDLVLSGHAHGGQGRIPFLLNGLVAPNQGWFPKYAGGLYQHGELKHILSRGLSINPRLPRIFNPPEVVVITLSSQ